MDLIVSVLEFLSSFIYFKVYQQIVSVGSSSLLYYGLFLGFIFCP